MVTGPCRASSGCAASSSANGCLAEPPVLSTLRPVGLTKPLPFPWSDVWAWSPLPCVCMAGVSILIPGAVFYGASLHGDPAKPVLVIICKGPKSKQSQLRGPFGLCHNSCPCSGRMNSVKTTGSLGSRVFHHYHQPSWLGWDPGFDPQDHRHWHCGACL